MVKFQSLFERGGLSLDRLRSFALIAEAGGLSRAAGGNPARISLFSRQLKELEEFFGTALTGRQGRMVVLTEAGQQLAELAQATLLGLDDFQRACRGMQQTLGIAASNSVLEWMILPRAAELRRALPSALLTFHSGRTQDLVHRLTDMTVDVGLLREDAVSAPLKSKRLEVVGYSLFLPRQFALPTREDRLKEALAEIPLATSMGGQFREHLEVAARKTGWVLKIDISCSSFTQAARVVHTGTCAGILPDLAAVDFNPREVKQAALPFLKAYARPISVAWNPRLLQARPVAQRAVNALMSLLG